MGDLCDNIGLVLVCLPSGSTDVTPSPSQYITLSCLLYFLCTCMLVIPIFPLYKFEEFWAGEDLTNQYITYEEMDTEVCSSPKKPVRETFPL